MVCMRVCIRTWPPYYILDLALPVFSATKSLNWTSLWGLLITNLSTTTIPLQNHYISLKKNFFFPLTVLTFLELAHNVDAYICDLQTYSSKICTSCKLFDLWFLSQFLLLPKSGLGMLNLTYDEVAIKMGWQWWLLFCKCVYFLIYCSWCIILNF